MTVKSHRLHITETIDHLTFHEKNKLDQIIRREERYVKRKEDEHVSVRYENETVHLQGSLYHSITPPCHQ